MKKLLLIVALVVASAAPALAEEFANPYSSCRQRSLQVKNGLMTHSGHIRSG